MKLVFKKTDNQNFNQITGLMDFHLHHSACHNEGRKQKSEKDY